MRTLKQLTIWAAEIMSQAILLGLLLIGLFGYDQHKLGRGLLAYGLAILMMFFTAGYLATTVISRIFCPTRKLWLYPVIATTLFVIHFEVMNIAVGGAFGPPDRVRIWITGACIAFLSTYVGTAVLQRWTAPQKNLP